MVLLNGVTPSKERPVSFSTSQRFEQTVMSGEGHSGPDLPGTENIKSSSVRVDTNYNSTIWKVYLSKAGGKGVCFSASVHYIHGDVFP